MVATFFIADFRLDVFCFMMDLRRNGMKFSSRIFTILKTINSKMIRMILSAETENGGDFKDCENPCK